MVSTLWFTKPLIFITIYCALSFGKKLLLYVVHESWFYSKKKTPEFTCYNARGITNNSQLKRVLHFEHLVLRIHNIIQKITILHSIFWKKENYSTWFMHHGFIYWTIVILLGKSPWYFKILMQYQVTNPTDLLSQTPYYKIKHPNNNLLLLDHLTLFKFQLGFRHVYPISH